MNRYNILISQGVYKKLQKLPSQIEEKLLEVMVSLQENPRPFGYKKLKGKDGYRVRTGDFRIIYQINDTELLILVLDIGNRKDIYR